MLRYFYAVITLVLLVTACSSSEGASDDATSLSSETAPTSATAVSPTAAATEATPPETTAQSSTTEGTVPPAGELDVTPQATPPTVAPSSAPPSPTPATGDAPSGVPAELSGSLSPDGVYTTPLWSAQLLIEPVIETQQDPAFGTTVTSYITANEATGQNRIVMHQDLPPEFHGDHDPAFVEEYYLGIKAGFEESSGGTLQEIPNSPLLAADGTFLGFPAKHFQANVGGTDMDWVSVLLRERSYTLIIAPASDAAMQEFLSSFEVY